MRVNGREELACVCSLAEHGDDIRVEPLANLPTLMDVVVDMRPFYDRFPDEHPLIRVSEVPAAARPDDDHPFVRLEDCIECGLCVSACPVAAPETGFVGPAALVAAARSLEEPRSGEREDVLAWISRPEGVWQCTTCRACVDRCPAGIDPMGAIVDMRRALVERGDVDPLMQQALQNFAMQGNSYGKSARRRARWTRGLDFTIPDARKEPVEYVWFVGDFASFDERVQRESQRLAKILHDAGVSFGLLFDGERNAGNDVRQVGEQGLFEMLVEHNMNAFADARFEAIFTTDPHSLNTLRNDYPQYGLDKPVYHYTELLADLAAQGRLALGPTLAGARVTYHDPCYLARYNGITDAPRELIAATGAELVEMPRHGSQHVLLRRRRRSDLGRRVGRRRTPERAAHPRGAGPRWHRLLRRQLSEGPDHVHRGRSDGRRRRVRSRRADGAARTRPGLTAQAGLSAHRWREDCRPLGRPGYPGRLRCLSDGRSSSSPCCWAEPASARRSTGCWRMSAAGQSAVLVVRGEAGVGKTALLHYCARQASGFRVAQDRRASSPRWSCRSRDCISSARRCSTGSARSRARSRPRWASRWGCRPGAAPDRFLVALAALSLLAEVAEERPLLCLVDDAQWLDAASARSLGFVARRLLAESVAIVFAVREPTDERELVGLPELALRGLADGGRARPARDRHARAGSTSASATGSSPRRAAIRWRCSSCRAG